MECSILSEVDDTSFSGRGSPRRYGRPLNWLPASNLLPAQRAGAQRLCALALLGQTGRHRESLIIGFQRTLLAVSRRTARGCIGPRRKVIFRRLPSCSLSRVERAERPVDTIYRSGLLGATQACTAVFEKHLPLRPVHA